MSAQFEEAVKAASRGGKRSSVRVTTTYNRTHPLQARVAVLESSRHADDQVIAAIIRAERYVATALTCQAMELRADGTEGNQIAALHVSNTIADRREEDYQLTPQPRRRVYINEMSQAELGELGFAPAMAERIFKRRPYRTWEEIAERASISESRLDQAVNTTGYDVRIYRL